MLDLIMHMAARCVAHIPFSVSMGQLPFLLLFCYTRVDSRHFFYLIQLAPCSLYAIHNSYINGTI